MLSKTPTGRLSKAVNASKTVKKEKEALRISDRLNPQAIHPLGQHSHQTPFSALYAKGGIPCRFIHGSVKHKIQWITPIEKLDYQLIIPFIQGLRETRHPFNFVVRQGLLELLDAPGASIKIIPLLNSFMIPLRNALCSQNDQTFEMALECVHRLASMVKIHLTLHLSLLLPPIAHRVLSKNVKLREKSLEALAQCELHCGPDALKILKARVPTYSSIHALK